MTAYDPVYEQKIQSAVQDSVEQEARAGHEIITLSNGVQLKTQPVPVLRIQAILSRFKYPPVPETYDPDKDRVYRNPHNPQYVEAREQVDLERTLAIIDAVVALGTSLHYKPDHVPAVDDDEWIDEIEILGIPVEREKPKARYLAWVKYVAVVSQDDLVHIARQAGLNMGVSEERVATALQSSFQDN